MGSSLNRYNCALGIDFGTLSARVVVVDIQTGEQLAVATRDYPSGVITERLPGSDKPLPAGFALQDPADYLSTLVGGVRAAMTEAAIDSDQVVGIGISFTSCTILPVDRGGTPLCFDSTYRQDPHAWVQLWKHLTAQQEADLMTEVALTTGEVPMERYGNRMSAQRFFPKVWHMLREAPHVYMAADRIIEAGDWIVWQLTGREMRSMSMAGYKALWDPVNGYPSEAFFARLDPRLATVVVDKVQSPLVPAGQSAGTLSETMASRLGLSPGIPVSAAAIDAHAAVVGSGVTEPNQAVLVMGTSLCHMVLAEACTDVDGICGVVEGGVIPGLHAYESGQPALGDLLRWYVEHHVPAAYATAAEAQGESLYRFMEVKAAQLHGDSGLLALDWWNGNRSILDNADLTGLVVGCTLETRPEHVYLALMESLAYGTRVILESFAQTGIALERLVACGGVPNESPLLMQVFADVTGQPIQVAAAQQASALGAAVYGAVAAGQDRGGHAMVQDAVSAMTQPPRFEYVPNPERHAAYQQRYHDYRQLHDLFGLQAKELMERLRR